MSFRIRIFSDFCSSEVATNNYIKLYGYDPGYFVFDLTYTHVILLNNAMPDLTHPFIPKHRVIGLAHEPIQFLRLTPEFMSYANQYIGRYFIGNTLDSRLPPPFEQHNGYMWYTSLTYEPFDKPRFGMSLMLSTQKMLPGHQYRHALAHEIIRRNLPVDIWGNGTPELKKLYGDRPQIKEAFEDNDSLYRTYKYTIVIENSVHPAYFSEKILSPLVTETIPLYLGSTDIQQTFGTKMCIPLSGLLDQDLKQIKELCILSIIQPNETHGIDFKTIKNLLWDLPQLNLYKAIVTEYLFSDI